MAATILRSERPFPSGIRRVAINYERDVCEFELTDGAVIIAPMGPQRATGFTRSEYDVERSELRLTLPGGDELVAEVGGDRTGGRPVVYLDQNHWIHLGWHLHTPERVPSAEREACQRIIELGLAGAVVLPLSAAHMTETGRSDGLRRRHAALTMLQLTRGWQMHSPLRVRQRELLSQFDVVPPVAESWPFSRQPNVIFADRAGADRYRANPALPAPARLLTERMASTSAIFAELLEDEIDEHALNGVERAGRWAGFLQQLADRCSSDRLNARQIDANATLALVSDLRVEIAEAAAKAGRSPTDVERWIERVSSEGLDALPFLWWLREAISHKLKDARNRWEPNDLNDLTFLACAAGYADVVVGEKATINLLSRSAHLRTDGPALFDKLHTAIDEIERRAGAS